MTYNPEKPQAPSPEGARGETRVELAKARLKAFMSMSPTEMIQYYFRERKQFSPTERREMLKAMFFVLVFAKLGLSSKLKKEQEEAAEEEANPPTVPTEPEKKEDQPQQKNDQAPVKTAAAAPPLPPVDTAKFRSGPDVTKSLTEHFTGIEIQRQGIPLKTAIAKDRPGAPAWTKESTDNWNWTAAGNTDEKIKEGIYSIEGTLPPDGYTRSGTDNLPGETRTKLTAICMALLKDPRMPLFTGIAMTVDGVEVMLVKEIHLHPRGTASTYLCQPHTGVSYIMKKV